MNNIPESMDQVQTLVDAAASAGHPTTVDAVIATGLQQWAQDYLDEATEGSYFTAKLDGNQIHITDMNGVEVATPSLADTTYIEAFKADSRGSLTEIANTLRALIANHDIAL